MKIGRRHTQIGALGRCHRPAACPRAPQAKRARPGCSQARLQRARRYLDSSGSDVAHRRRRWAPFRARGTESPDHVRWDPNCLKVRARSASMLALPCQRPLSGGRNEAGRRLAGRQSEGRERGRQREGGGALGRVRHESARKGGSRQTCRQTDIRQAAIGSTD